MVGEAGLTYMRKETTYHVLIPLLVVSCHVNSRIQVDIECSTRITENHNYMYNIFHPKYSKNRAEPRL